MHPAPATSIPHAPRRIALLTLITLLALALSVLTWNSLQRCRWLDVWLARSGRVALLLIQRIQAHPRFISRIAFIPQHNWLASVGDTTSLRVWDVADGLLVYEVPAEIGVEDLAFTPDGRTGLLPLYQRVQRWQVADSALLDSWAAGQGNLMSIDVAPDGQTVVTGGAAGDSVARV